MRDFSGVREDVAFGEFEKIVESGDLVTHVHRLAIERLEFREVEVGRYDQIQDIEFVFVEIVLRDCNVGHSHWAGRGVRPVGQTHVRLGGIGLSSDHFGGGVTVSGPVPLVLHGLEEDSGGFVGWVVVDARGADVCDLLYISRSN